MGAFEYTALDAKGRNRRGILEGDSASQVRQRLREQSLVPMTVAEVRQSVRKGKGRGGVRRADLVLATRQLATLTGSGLPVEEALATVSRQTDNRRLSNVMLAIRGKVLEGHSLAAGLGEFPQLFSEMFRETVGAGEQTGHLEQVLERLAVFQENSHKLRQKVMLAMIYPAIVLVFALLVTSALLTYVVPQVIQVFADFNQDLPFLTRFMIRLSDFLRNHGVVAVGLLIAMIFLSRILLAREPVKRLWHRILLRLPLTSRLVRGINTAQFTRTFGILTGSGVPVLEGLRISSRVIDNRPMREALQDTARQVREGGSLHKALGESRVFSPLVIHLIASGETSGNLANMLNRAADAQEQEVETLVAVLAGVLEPLLILFMGGIVLTIVIAILLPIFDLNQLVH
ncbi:MAG: type II secretion system inner membrane protein GspF [Magnetococcales bacterium]|nr:type II secretion system inner membrane protein GspF [Magnetococcales bacterium]